MNVSVYENIEIYLAILLKLSNSVKIKSFAYHISDILTFKNSKNSRFLKIFLTIL